MTTMSSLAKEAMWKKRGRRRALLWLPSQMYHTGAYLRNAVLPHKDYRQRQDRVPRFKQNCRRELAVTGVLTIIGAVFAGLMGQRLIFSPLQQIGFIYMLMVLIGLQFTHVSYFAKFPKRLAFSGPAALFTGAMASLVSTMLYTPDGGAVVGYLLFGAVYFLFIVAGFVWGKL